MLIVRQTGPQSWAASTPAIALPKPDCFGEALLDYAMTNRDHHYLLPDDREAAEIAREYSAPQYAGHPLAQLYAMQHAVERHCPGESRQLIWASPIRMDYDARTFLWLPAFEFHRPLISAYH